MNCFKLKALLLLATAATAAVSSAVGNYSAVRLQSIPGYTVADVRGASSGRAVGMAAALIGNGYDVPVLWDLETGSAQQLPVPAGFMKATASGIEGNSISGSAFDGTCERAVLWKLVGSVWTPEILNPGTAFNSVGYGVSNGKVVGATSDFSPVQAAVWQDADASPGLDHVNLTPAASFATCNAIANDMKVGVADGMATVWDAANNPSALSMTDGSPNFFIFSEASATNGSAHGGYVMSDQSVIMAALWSGGNLTTMHDPAWLMSFVRGMNTTNQVGFATTFDGFNYNDRAHIWSGAPGGEDLHQFLPAGYVSSNAYAIDTDGRIVGTANTASGEVHAYVWRRPSYTFSRFCAPVNDPATPVTVVKRGAVVPLIIKVFNGNGAQVNNVKVILSVQQLGIGGGDVNTDLFDTVFDLGPYFRSLLGQYIYLMSTSDLQKGKQYKLTATVEGTTDSHSVVIGIK